MAKRAAGATLPEIRVVGTHADLGRAMGQGRAKQIRAATDSVLKQMEEFKITEAALRQQIAPYVEAGERIFPQYMVELREMARAAEVPFEYLFRLNCYESSPPGTWPRGRRQEQAAPAPGATEPPAVPAKDPGTLAAANAAANATTNGRLAAGAERVATAADGCTSVVSPGDTGMVVGHTEDSFPEAVEGLYLLDATVTERNPFTSAERHRYLGLNYAQTLPGCAAAVNEHGLIVLIDALPDPDRNVGAPRHMVSRALLDVPSIDAAIDLLRTTDRGGGWNYVMIQGQRAVNVETTATRVVATSIAGAGYAHTNHYVDPQLAADSGEPRPNSFARLTRAMELVRPQMDVAAMKQLLSDRQGEPDSICRDRTIGAFVADTAARRVDVCWGEPAEGTWTTYAY
jgi:hypothetical protein